MSAAVGADASRWGLRRAAQAGGGLTLVQADATGAPFRRATFDAVRAVHLLGHLDSDEAAAALLEIRRTLRPGGVAAVADFGRGDFRYGIGDAVAPHSFRRGAGIVTRYFDAPEYAALLRRADLEVIRLESERFSVRYAGEVRPRERVWAWARA